MLINNRIIWDDNGTLKDLSPELNNVFSLTKTLALVAAQDKIYIGSDLPFNHRYFMVSTANDQASVITVKNWNGSEWVATVDLVDQTLDSGGTKTLGQSGILSWVTDRNKTWGLEETTENIDELATLKIYNMYWVQLTFSGNLGASTALKYVGHKFSNDIDLGGQYPDLLRSNVLDAFLTGKTTWDEQHVLAAEEVIRDLRKKQIIISRNQVFGWEEFTDAAKHKVAELVYSAFGKDYEERRETAREYYEDSLDKIVFQQVDKNADGRVTPSENYPSYSRLVRG